MPSATYYQMQHPAELGPVTVWNEHQKRALGELLGEAISEGRHVELRTGPARRSILVLVSAADDLGHAYEVSVGGKVDDVGITEKMP